MKWFVVGLLKWKSHSIYDRHNADNYNYTSIMEKQAAKTDMWTWGETTHHTKHTDHSDHWSYLALRFAVTVIVLQFDHNFQKRQQIHRSLVITLHIAFKSR